ncbi:MAG: HEAT repeat domain-containing protein [Chloroflexota bacterium]|nr:HEAT repeat domain-containing protein [Chloroflexota bacterium]
MSSVYWDRFYESFFGDPYMAWHDGLDLEALLALEGEEREEAERLLLDGLSTSDYRPARGLEALRSQQSVAPLKARLKTARGTDLINTARALWEIERYPRAAEVLITVLHAAPFWGERVDAAIALKMVKTPASIDALWKALDDPEALVRHHAVASLLELHGIYTEDWRGHPLATEIMTPESRETAITELKKLLGKEGG